jgi:hypothetical protein
MPHSKCKFALLAFLVSSVVSSSHASESIASSGFYLGAGVTPVMGYASKRTSIDPGASISLGCQITPAYAVEVDYVGFLEAFTTGNLIDFSAKAFVSLTPKLSAFGKLGVAYVHLDTDIDIFYTHFHTSYAQWAPAMGGGFDYHFTPNFAAELSAVAVPIKSIVMVPMTLGLHYTFG